MKVFLDTEFTSLNQHAQLISLALVDEEGREFYAEFDDYDTLKLSKFQYENVIVNLFYQNMKGPIKEVKESCTLIKGSTETIVSELKSWLKSYEIIEIWADVLAYDWVLFCELFGGALAIPHNIFFAPFDLSTLIRVKGLIQPRDKYNNDISRYKYVNYNMSGQHNALHDARVSKLCYEKLMDI